MTWNTVLLLLAGVVGFLGIVLGAAGKHAFEGKAESKLYGNFETGLKYHQVHGLALLAVALGSLAATGQKQAARLRVSGWLLLTGVVVFSGSLYLLAFTGQSGLGKVTPVGGTLLMLGWLSLCWAALAKEH